jgi:hypothetical protein
MGIPCFSIRKNPRGSSENALIFCRKMDRFAPGRPVVPTTFPDNFVKTGKIREKWQSRSIG